MGWDLCWCNWHALRHWESLPVMKFHATADRILVIVLLLDHYFRIVWHKIFHDNHVLVMQYWSVVWIRIRWPDDKFSWSILWTSCVTKGDWLYFNTLTTLSKPCIVFSLAVSNWNSSVIYLHLLKSLSNFIRSFTARYPSTSYTSIIHFPGWWHLRVGCAWNNLRTNTNNCGRVT